MKNVLKTRPAWPSQLPTKMSNTEVESPSEKKVEYLIYERVGVTLRANLVALKSETGDAGKFAALAGKVKAAGDINIILYQR